MPDCIVAGFAKSHSLAAADDPRLQPRFLCLPSRKDVCENSRTNNDGACDLCNQRADGIGMRRAAVRQLTMLRLPSAGMLRCRREGEPKLQGTTMSAAQSEPKRWCYASLVAAMLTLCTCAGPSQLSATRKTQVDLQRYLAATQDAIECRNTAAGKPQYQVLDYHMPLKDIGAATLPQLIDPKFATGGEISALDAWTRDVNACRTVLLQATESTLPAFGPIIEEFKG